MRSAIALRLVPSLLLTLTLIAWAQDGAEGVSRDRYDDPALPFRVERPEGGVPIFVLGVNRFTLLQMSEFVAGVETFLRRAEAIEPGAQLVWRREGLRGYLSLSTSPFADGPEFLMTLRGEPVRTFDDATAVLGTMTRLGLRVLAHSPAAPPAVGSDDGRRPSPPVTLTR